MDFPKNLDGLKYEGYCKVNLFLIFRPHPFGYANFPLHEHFMSSKETFKSIKLLKIIVNEGSDKMGQNLVNILKMPTYSYVRIIAKLSRHIENYAKKKCNAILALCPKISHCTTVDSTC